MTTPERDKTTTAAILDLVWLAGMLALVVLQDPTLRSEARSFVERLKVRARPVVEPAPAQVSAVIASAEDILKRGE